MMRRRLLLLCLAAALARRPLPTSRAMTRLTSSAPPLDGAARGAVLARGVSPNARDPNGETGLIVAMRYESLNVARLLMEQPGIDLEAGAQRQHRADDGGLPQNRQAVLEMLKRGAQVNQKGWTALHYAAAGSVEIAPSCSTNTPTSMPNRLPA
jgi:ankyrin repeat protein